MSKLISIVFLFSILLPIDETIVINASSFSEWKYFIFYSDGIEEVNIENPGNSYDWDIAVMRNHFRTNSGNSGNALGGAILLDSTIVFNSDNWDDLNEINGSVYFVTDGMLDNIYDIVTHTYSEAPGSNILELWGWFDFDNNYQMNPNNYRYVIRTADGKGIVKLWIQDYYNELGQSAHITIRYSTDITCDYDNCGICGGDGSTCTEDCNVAIGDVNGDGGFNVLDVVMLANCILANSCSELEFVCASDLNNDAVPNVLDIVSLVNCILSQNCQ